MKLAFLTSLHPNVTYKVDKMVSKLSHTCRGAQLFEVKLKKVVELRMEEERKSMQTMKKQ